jgi:hypothetical protein
MAEILHALLHLFLSEETVDKIRRCRGHSDVQFDGSRFVPRPFVLERMTV